MEKQYFSYLKEAGKHTKTLCGNTNETKFDQIYYQENLHEEIDKLNIKQ